MDEVISQLFVKMCTREIEEAKRAILNEHVWELGYEGEEPNPHTENIKRLNTHVNILEGLAQIEK